MKDHGHIRRVNIFGIKLRPQPLGVVIISFLGHGPVLNESNIPLIIDYVFHSKIGQSQEFHKQNM